MLLEEAVSTSLSGTQSNKTANLECKAMLLCLICLPAELHISIALQAGSLEWSGVRVAAHMRHIFAACHKAAAGWFENADFAYARLTVGIRFSAYVRISSWLQQLSKSQRSPMMHAAYRGPFSMKPCA